MNSALAAEDGRFGDRFWGAPSDPIIITTVIMTITIVINTITITYIIDGENYPKRYLPEPVALSKTQ